MPKKYTDEEYARMLPKKQVGTAVLFFNAAGELLIVKPDYKEGWLVPGGSCDENESPLHCAVRETQEEIGLTIPELVLAGVYYGAPKGVFGDSLKFIYNGGVLTDEQIASIQLQAEELTAMEFKPVAEAVALLSASLQKSIPECLNAIRNKTVTYVESDISKE